MKTLIVAALVLACSPCIAQKAINTALKKELKAILETDQGVREYMDSETTEQRKEALQKQLGYSRELLMKSPWMVMAKIDSVNIEKADRIIARYGYPGKSMVGEPENTAIFYVVQHSAKIEKYYPLIEKAAAKGELPFRLSAMMLDRKLAQEKKEQIYGTQLQMQMINDPATGKKVPFWYVVPIKDPANVNQRRKEAGFDSTMEDNAKRLGTVYKPYTYQQLEAIFKQ